MEVERVLAVLRAHRFYFTNEEELQQGIARVLSAQGFAFEREHVLSKKERADFFLDGIVIEVKCAGSATQLLMQLQRYARFPAVTAIVLVVSKSRLTTLPNEVGGKPVFGVLQTGW